LSYQQKNTDLAGNSTEIHWQADSYTTTHRLNGYSDYASPVWRVDARALRHFPCLEGFEVLHRCHARYVIVHRELYGARDLRETDARLAHFRDYLPEIVRDGSLELYEVAGFPKS